jgi:signal transduction histidine kinase
MPTPYERVLASALVQRLVSEVSRRRHDKVGACRVYRIAIEAVRNAFLHARASRIEAEIRYDPRHLRVRVRDDGIGIEPAVLQHDGPAGHWGLKGMRERARRIGGKLDVWTDHDAGTEVELTVPASTAYGSACRRSSWRRKKKEAASS